jgi:glycosyltransferase involved in cell wall biosynthesis
MLMLLNGAGKKKIFFFLSDFEKEFFNKEIQPWIDQYPKNLVFKFHEEIDRPLLFDLYKRAKCTLFTSQWEEPFGLAMTESMACGTPVVALRRGAAPEVIVDGKTGFVVDTEDEMIKVLHKVDKINPEACRLHIEENFSREKMAKDYLNVYKKLLSV